MASLRNKTIRLAYETSDLQLKEELTSILRDKRADESKYKPGEFGYWWTVTKGEEDIEGDEEIEIDCSYQKLTSLRGAPKEVFRNFDCSKNNLTSLKGAPQKVGGWFECNANKLKSLEGAPKSADSFDCQSNPVKFTEEDVRAVCKVADEIST